MVFHVYFFYFAKSIDAIIQLFGLFQIILMFKYFFILFRIYYYELDLDEHDFHRKGFIPHILSIIYATTILGNLYNSKVQRTETKKLLNGLSRLSKLNKFVSRMIDDQNKANEICEENK